MFSNALETDIQEGEKILKRLMMYASSGKEWRLQQNIFDKLTVF